MAIFRSRIRDVTKVVDDMQDQLETYLEDTNMNARELMENRVMIQELNDRLCKLSDSICMLKEDLHRGTDEQLKSLTLREQEVFLSLYMQDQPVQYAVLARQLSLPVGLVQDIVVDLIERGVHVVRERTIEGDILVSLDGSFKERQSKYNLLGLNQNLSKQMSKEMQQTLLD